jgi:predicted dehydrogenase
MKIGVVGAGTIGRLRARTVRENPATRLVAVFDTASSATAQAIQGTGAVAAASLEAFMDVDMDAVIVSTPLPLHEVACVEAFRRGRHVLCEKPLTNSVESARRVVDAARGANKALGVGFNLRYYPSVHFVRETIASGRIGSLDHLRIFGGHDGLHNFRAEWQYRAPDSGGGAMWDVGIHMTDLARYFLGEITDVYGVMSERVWKVAGSEDNAMAVLRNPEGLAATYQATWFEWKGYGFAIEAYGDQGMVRGSYAPMQNLLVTREGGRRQRKRLFYPEIMVREKLRSWTDTALRTFREELTDFLALAAGNDGGRIADGNDGLRAIEVADAVRASTVSGEAVHLPPLGRLRPVVRA